MTKAPATKKKTKHQKIANSPEVKPLIVKLRQDWQTLDNIQLGRLLRELVRRGCSLRGIASDLGVPETTLRRYMNFSPPVAPLRAAVEAPAQDKKKIERVADRDRIRPQTDPGKGKQRPGVEKSPMHLSDELAEIMLDFCKNALPGEPIRDYDLPVLLREVKKCLRGEMWVTLASIELPKDISLPELYRITRPPESSEDHWLARRAIWLATMVKAKAPESIRETAFRKAMQRAAELKAQPTPEEKQPIRIHR